MSDRTVFELRARLTQQSEAIEQLRSEVGWLTNELIARDAGAGAPSMEGAPPEWVPMLHAIRRFTHQHVPQGSQLAIVSSGVEALLRYAGYGADHLSQDRVGDYVGSHPSCGRAAVVQLEAARWRGVERLLIPRSELWWLDNYPEFAKHLEQRCTRVADDETAGVIWDLREPGRLRDVHDLLASLCNRLDHRPALLDWHTGHDLASCFDEYKIFSPLSDALVLPYVDDSVDAVAIGDATAGRIAEARRVASSFVIRIAPEATLGIEVVWRASGVDDGSRDVSIVAASRGDGPSASDFAVRLLDTLPTGFAGEVVLDRACCAGPLPARAKGVKIVDCPEGESFGARLQRCATAATGDVLVGLEGAIWPTSGWLRPLVALLRDVDSAALVTGMLVAPDGGLVAAGSGEPPSPDGRLDAAQHGFVRRLDPTPARFFATRRDLFLEWAAQAAPSDRDVAAPFGAFARSQGRTLLYEPDAVAIAPWSREVVHDG